MCGIFGIINSPNNQLSSTIKHRGPDNTTQIISFDNIYYFCFHRLSINDTSNNGNQPFETSDYIIMCNGEIYNYKQLIISYRLKCNSTSDCEVISKLYEKFNGNVDKIINVIHGVFAFCIYNKKKKDIYLVRDPIGVRPLYYSLSDNKLYFSSEGKALTGTNIKQLNPGTYLYYNHNSYWCNRYYSLPRITNYNSIDSVKFTLKKLLIDSVKMRTVSDRPIGCLLSGGLDSSLIASILSHVSDKPIKTFSVGFEDSEDLIYARKVAQYINSDHHELILQYDDILPRISEVIKSIETYDVTTIRASIGMYFLSKYISENFDERVIFSGEGSDELLCGYLYFHKYPNKDELENESKRLVYELYKYDVLRADRCTSAFGLELRVPFLDINFVNFVMSLCGDLRAPIDGVEKHLLRQSFENNYLPEEILNRKKEAFSDGVGNDAKPFYKHIQEYIRKNTDYDIDDDDELEKRYYRDIYESFYSYKPIDYYWMPKWVNVTNPSAKVL